MYIGFVDGQTIGIGIISGVIVLARHLVGYAGTVFSVGNYNYESSGNTERSYCLQWYECSDITERSVRTQCNECLDYYVMYECSASSERSEHNGR